MDIFAVSVVAVAGLLRTAEERATAYLLTECWALRQQLAPHGRIRFTDAQRRRLAVKAKALGLAGLRQLDTVVTPETLLRWHRQLVAKKYDGSDKRGTGRPRVREEIETLIVRMARENHVTVEKLREVHSATHPAEGERRV